jgi:hypothetical protein
MQYVSLEIVRYAASHLAVLDDEEVGVTCESGPHDAPAEYLIPNASRPGGGEDIEHRPAFVCLDHLEELLGGIAPEDQPVWRRLEEPDEY